MAKKKQQQCVLARPWYGAMLCLPTAQPIAKEAVVSRRVLNAKGLITMATDTPRPSTACFGAPLPGGSFDDMYTPRVVFVPVRLADAEGRLGLHMPQRRALKCSVLGMADGASSGGRKGPAGGIPDAPLEHRMAIDSAPSIARALLEQVPATRLRALLDLNSTEDQWAAAWAAEVRFSRLVKRIYQTGLRCFWQRSGLTPETLYVHRMNEAGCYALFYCNFYAAVNTAVAKARVLMAPAETRAFSAMLEAFRLFIEGVSTATPCLLEPAGGQNLFEGYTVLLLEAVDAACDGVCDRRTWLGACCKETGRAFPSTGRVNAAARTAWLEVRRLMLCARKSLRVAGLASQQMRAVTKLFGCELTYYSLVTLCRARDDSRACYGYNMRMREIARCLVEGRDPAAAHVAFSFGRFARELASGTGEDPMLYMPPVYVLKTRMREDVSNSGGIASEWLSALGPSCRTALKVFMARMQDECEFVPAGTLSAVMRLSGKPTGEPAGESTGESTGEPAGELPASARAFLSCEWTATGTETAFAHYCESMLSHVPVGDLVAREIGSAANGEPRAVVAEALAWSKSRAKVAARAAAREATAAAAADAMRRHEEKEAARELAIAAATRGTTVTAARVLARVTMHAAAMDAAEVALVRASVVREQDERAKRIEARIRRLAAVEKAAWSGSMIVIARAVGARAASQAASLSRARRAAVLSSTTEAVAPPPPPTPPPTARAEARAAAAEARAAAAEAHADARSAAADAFVTYNMCRVTYNCALSVLQFRLETTICAMLPHGACPELTAFLDPFTGGVPISALVPYVWSGGMPGTAEENIKYAAMTSFLVEPFASKWIRVRAVRSQSPPPPPPPPSPN